MKALLIVALSLLFANQRITIRNGYEYTGNGQEVEILLPDDANTRIVKFRVTSGTMQVTTALANQQGVIGGQIHAYGTGEPDYMAVEQSKGWASQATNIYIKGTGTIVFSW